MTAIGIDISKAKFDVALERNGKRLDIERVLAMLADELRQLEEKINRHIDQNPGLKKEKSLLESIPGVGETLSHYLMAWLRVKQLENVRQAVAFIGLSPKANESGSSQKGRAVLKSGDPFDEKKALARA